MTTKTSFRRGKKISRQEEGKGGESGRSRKGGQEDGKRTSSSIPRAEPPFVPPTKGNVAHISTTEQEAKNDEKGRAELYNEEGGDRSGPVIQERKGANFIGREENQSRGKEEIRRLQVQHH